MAMVTHGYLAVERKKLGDSPLGGVDRQKEKMKEPSNAERAVDYIHAYIEGKKEREKRKEMNLDIKCWENIHPGSRTENRSHFTCPLLIYSQDCALAVVVAWI